MNISIKGNGCTIVMDIPLGVKLLCFYAPFNLSTSIAQKEILVFSFYFLKQPRVFYARSGVFWEEV